MSAPLTSAAPTGRAADPKLGLARYVRAAMWNSNDGPLGFADWDVEELVLDRFDPWLQRRVRAVGPDYPAAVRHAYGFVGFLDENYVGVHSCTEYDLRCYLYEQWARTHSWPAPARELLEGLARFCEFLDDHEDVTYQWAPGILADVDALEHRCRSYPEARYLDPRFLAWRQEFCDDLKARLLFPELKSADGGEWLWEFSPMSDEEYEAWEGPLLAVMGELSRRWLMWREEVIADGTTDPDEAHRTLVWRQWAWEQQPHPGLAGETPAHAVRRAGLAVEAARRGGG